MKQRPIRILQLVSSANISSGVRSVVVNWHKNIDTSQVQFDYLYVQMDQIASQNDILNLGECTECEAGFELDKEGNCVQIDA